MPACRLFQYSPQRLLDSVPTMFAFPKLGDVFGAITAAIPATVRTGVHVESVQRSRTSVTVTDASGHTAVFDELVFACGAEQARRMLGDDAGWCALAADGAAEQGRPLAQGEARQP